MDKSVTDYYLDLYSGDYEGELMTLEPPEEITFKVDDEVIVFLGENRDRTEYGKVVEVNVNKDGPYSHLVTTYKVATEDDSYVWASNKCMKLRYPKNPLKELKFKAGETVYYYEIEKDSKTKVRIVDIVESLITKSILYVVQHSDHNIPFFLAAESELQEIVRPTSPLAIKLEELKHEIHLIKTKVDNIELKFMDHEDD